MSRLPPAIERSPFAQRVRVAIEAAEATGAALRRVRSASHMTKEIGDQLKSGVDLAAEGWVVGYLHGSFDADVILSEEAFEAAAVEWSPPEAFWTVDALDGTRSFIDGFDGFCVQLAWIAGGAVRVGVVHEPLLDRTYVGVDGAGAYRVDLGTTPKRLALEPHSSWPDQPVFVDSTRPTDTVGALIRRQNGAFLELGSIGLKLCRVADGSAQIFAKRLRFKIWDVAPAQVILTEAGGVVGLWDGSPIPYDSRRVRFHDLLAAPRGLFELIAHDLSSGPSAAGTLA